MYLTFIDPKSLSKLQLKNVRQIQLTPIAIYKIANDKVLFQADAST